MVDDAKTLLGKTKLLRDMADDSFDFAGQDLLEDVVAQVMDLIAENARLTAEVERLTLLIPLTDEEAQKAYDEAPSVPISKERIAEILRYVLERDAGPIAGPLEQEAGKAGK